MIELIEETLVVARCAVCEKTREVALDSLVVKLLDANTAMVALPGCSCGAVEYLVRAARPEHPDPGSEGHRHQILVDYIHAELVARKRLATGGTDAERICPQVPSHLIARWFASGLRLREGDEAKP